MEQSSSWIAPSFGVTGKRVLISGGCGGIGAAFARAFYAAGATPVLADVRSPPEDLATKGFAFHSLDVRNDAAIAALARSIDSLDVLIHCAGKLVRWKEYEIETFQEIVDIHLVGAMRLATAFKAHLAASKGCIINIASMYSYFGSPHIPAYGAAKTALASLTKSLAIAWAGDRIRVNAIAPGWIKTEITRPGRENPDFNRKVLERLPIGRWAEPEELAGAAIFLASPAASLVTGVTLPVDGGYSAA
jgi:NAD(P)-dependent dehydrogenase (short-subunit alcohol dehydrogenase family)